MELQAETPSGTQPQTRSNDRIYQGDDQQWYYRMRGNSAVGPFSSALDAETKLKKQISGWPGQVSNPAIKWPRALQPGRLFRRSGSRQT